MKKNIKSLINKNIAIFLSIFLLFGGCIKTTDEELSSLIKTIEDKVVPMQNQIKLAEYQAAMSGKDDDYQKSVDLKIQLVQIYSEKEIYKKLEKFVKKNNVEDKLLKQQLNLFFNEYKYHQNVTEELSAIIKEAVLVEKKFSVYRAEIDNKKYTDSKIEEILTKSTDSKLLEKAWKASKQVGALISADLIDLVKKRNKVAQKAGYANYYEFRLLTNGQDSQSVQQLFDELYVLIQKPYAQLKYEVDDFIADRCSLDLKNLRPWHYQNRYFQQAPAIYPVDFDSFYKNKNVVDITNKYFKSIGLDVSDIISNSDLQEKEGKRQFSEAIDINRNGDVRVIASLIDDEYSMYSALYEFGWAAYLKRIDNNLPWALKQPAHFLSADAVATFFSDLSTNPLWMAEMGIINDSIKNQIAENAKKTKKLEKFVFASWSQVMYRFEKSMYENPEQDLNKLWWDLVEKYQLIARPDDWSNPDWATKAHIITLPCTYHNYMLGELFAAQLNTYLIENIAAKNASNEVSYSNNPKIGQFLTENVFRPGSMYDWAELVKKATGDNLSPDFYKNRIIY